LRRLGLKEDIMRLDNKVRLECQPGRIDEVGAHLLFAAQDRAVLNVGASGGVEYYLPDRANLWLHARLDKVASSLVGIDIDTAAVAHAARYGWKIERANCEEARFERTFDMILLVDVIEHVSNPGQTLDNLVGQLAPSGELYITTPNPAFAGDLARALIGRGPSTYWDHVASFAPEHLQAMCDRHGHTLAEVQFFSHRDRRNVQYQMKSIAIAALGRLNPRLNNSWLGVVRPGKAAT